MRRFIRTGLGFFLILGCSGSAQSSQDHTLADKASVTPTTDHRLQAKTTLKLSPEEDFRQRFVEAMKSEDSALWLAMQEPKRRESLANSKNLEISFNIWRSHTLPKMNDLEQKEVELTEDSEVRWKHTVTATDPDELFDIEVVMISGQLWVSEN